MTKIQCEVCHEDYAEIAVYVLETQETFMVSLSCLKLTFGALQDIINVNDIFNKAMKN